MFMSALVSANALMCIFMFFRVNNTDHRLNETFTWKYWYFDPHHYKILYRFINKVIMRTYENSRFEEIQLQLNGKKSSVLRTEIDLFEFTNLQFYLTRSLYYAVIVDDYPFKISDKESLMEALYYQLKLITVHDLNWDAIQDGLGDALDYYSEFDGICLLFRDKEIFELRHIKTLSAVVDEINAQSHQNRIFLIFNE